MTGPAFTVKARPGGTLMLHRAIDLAAPGDVIVVDADLGIDTTGALMMGWVVRRGIRDAAQLGGRELGGWVVEALRPKGCAGA